jgi:hypothetical protein
LHWGHDPRKSNLKVLNVAARLQSMVSDEGLTAADLLMTFLSRWLLPLQGRPHKLCHMSGWKDPSWTSSVELDSAEVARLVNLVSNAKLAENWEWGRRSYDRSHRAPVVS